MYPTGGTKRDALSGSMNAKGGIEPRSGAKAKEEL